jgi:ATP-dependent RNA helicase DDX52/ROK1
VKSKHVEGKSSSKVDDGELPSELDFFKYAKGGTNKRKATEQNLQHEGKKQKTNHASEDEQGVEDDDNDTSNSSSLIPKHRVTAKGSRVPEHVNAFETLADRYQVPSRLLKNLSNNGYNHPTGIQSYGIPILLEVSLCCTSRAKT